jgi:hypothetical protein
MASSHGGKRSRAGRKAKFGEPTVPIRVPASKLHGINLLIAGDNPIDIKSYEINTLSDTEQSRVNKAIEKEYKRLQSVFKQEVKQKVDELVAEARRRYREQTQRASETETRYKALITDFTALMTMQEYKLVRGCLHPDRVHGGIDADKLTKAYEIFSRLEKTVNICP